MAGRISRRKLAQYVAEKLEAGVSTRSTLRELAAYLAESRRVREYELIVRDIEDVLAGRGTVIADVTSAHELSDDSRKNIKKTLGSSSVYLREIVDASVLGGVRIDTPGKRYDSTIRHKLNALKAKQL
jgi:F-type H+-transporting ATPase subunit delta